MTGIEPVTLVPKTSMFPLHYIQMVYTLGIEPSKPKDNWFTASPVIQLGRYTWWEQ